MSAPGQKGSQSPVLKRPAPSARDTSNLQLPFDADRTSAPIVRFRVDGMRRPLAFVGDHITASGGRSRKPRPRPRESARRMPAPSGLPSLWLRGRRGRLILILLKVNRGGLAPSGRRGGAREDSPQALIFPEPRNTQHPSPSAAKVGVSPELEIRSCRAPSRQSEINRANSPQNTLLPLIPLSGPTRPLPGPFNPTGGPPPPLRTP
jgi:hypothetical protein